MSSGLPHSLKSTESSSYEIMFSILDAVDTINEANSRLDKGEGKQGELMETVFKNLDIMTIEMKSLIQFWLLYKQKMIKEQKTAEIDAKQKAVG